jgi:hypothetical protein
MIGDLHEQTVGRATLLVRAVDGILGTERHSWHRDEARARALFPTGVAFGLPSVRLRHVPHPGSWCSLRGAAPRAGA